MPNDRKVSTGGELLRLPTSLCWLFGDKLLAMLPTCSAKPLMPLFRSAVLFFVLLRIHLEEMSFSFFGDSEPARMNRLCSSSATGSKGPLSWANVPRFRGAGRDAIVMPPEDRMGIDAFPASREDTRSNVCLRLLELLREPPLQEESLPVGCGTKIIVDVQVQELFACSSDSQRN